MIETAATNADAQGIPPRSGSRRRAIIVSIIFHVVLIACLLCWYVPQNPPSSVGQRKKNAATTGHRKAPSEVLSRLPATSGESVPADQIKASLDSALQQTEKLSEERMLSELEKKLRRLQSISSAESVQDTTHKIANTLGLSPGPVPSAKPVKGTFDTKTAQIHEVTRIRAENGDWLYESVLVDAAGRTQKIPLPKSEGEITYSTFQQLKQFPMADGIYRQLVMPMLQNMLKAMDLAEAKARELRKQELQKGQESGESRTQGVGPEVQRQPTDIYKSSPAARRD